MDDKTNRPRLPERKPFPGKKERKTPREEAVPGGQGAGERIAKRLARAGVASRRDAEDMIAAGRVRLNGRVLESPAVNVAAGDVIEVDGKEIPALERTRLFLFHKPAGVVTTNRDPEGRKTVFDVLPQSLPRLVTVGRLDLNTEGLLLLTNDGGLARTLELPSTGWLRRYRVRVHGKPDEKALAALADGVAVDGVFYGAVEATLDRQMGTNAWLTIGLREGKNREVRNILGSLGLEVTRLIRISYGPFQLGELPEGHVLEVKGRTLREQLGERLIESAGANFEAPVATPFPNKPVRREREEPEAEPVAAPAPPRRQREEPGEARLIRARKQREGGRDRALEKLSTRPAGENKGKPKGGPRQREEAPPPSRRRANVWMAPGARPRGEKRLEADAERERQGERPRRFAKDGPQKAKPSGPGGARPRGERRFEGAAEGERRQERPRRFDKDGPAKARPSRPDGDKRSAPGARPHGERRFGASSAEGERRQERPRRFDKDGPAKSRTPRPGGGKPYGKDKPGGGRPKPGGSGSSGRPGRPRGGSGNADRRR